MNIIQQVKKMDPQHVFYWLINVLVYNGCRMIPFRDKRIWVFGESGGNGYSDNTKYLFEYVNYIEKNEIRAVWLSYDDDIVSSVQSKGFEAYKIYSLMGIWLALRCGIAIYNKSLGDFGNIPLVGGACIVTPWHGAGFKKIYLAAHNGMSLQLKKVMDFFFCWTKVDFMMATSEYQRWQFQKRFNVTKKQIAITGQPRNDVLRNHIDREAFLYSLGIPQEKKVILYMPTYRPRSQGCDIEKNIIKTLITSRSLSSFLRERGAIFLIKLHPWTPAVDLEVDEPFYLLDHRKAMIDTQMLLAVSDIMVTDYSSCYVDYSILRRPVVFYVPDEEDYLPNMEGMDDEYYEICRLCQAHTLNELIDFLANPKDIVSKVTNDLFLDPQTLLNPFSKNVYEEIMKLLDS